MSDHIRRLLLDSLVDESDHGAPFQELLEDLMSKDPAAEVADLVRELRAAVVDGVVQDGAIGDDFSTIRSAREADYTAALTAWNRGDRTSDPYDELHALLLRLTCRGRAAWRSGAEQWQLDVSMDGRIEEDPASNSLSVLAACEELAEQLMKEWLASQPRVRLADDPPRIRREVDFVAHPGFPEQGVRMTWQIAAPASLRPGRRQQ